jgi:hypothetical protein
MTISNYIDLITSQHKTKPNFIAWLSSALNMVNDNVVITNLIPTSFDVDTAIGMQLDTLGEIIGRSRTLNFQPSGGSSPTLDDVNYRIALKAKISQNQWDGTTPQIYEIWNNLFPNVTLSVVDNQNMTISVLLEGQLEAVVQEMLAAGYIVPKPVGVGLTIIEVTNISDTTYIGVLVTGIDSITITIP